MLETVLIGRRRLVAAAVLGAATAGLQAAPAFPALERAALQVRAPERQVMQAAAQAGQRLVAVGERGLIVLSDDGGKSWRQARQVPVSVTLTAISFADDKLGWAVGHGGVVLHSRDAGETWVKQADGATLAQAALQAAEQALEQQAGSQPHFQAATLRALSDAKVLVADGPDKPLLDVHFQDARRGWVVGAYNLFFETDDGGQSWKSLGARLHNPKVLHLNAIRSQGQSVFIVGEQGQMHRSLDGGKTFEAVPSPYKGSWFTVALPADGSVLAAGLRGNAYRSPDFGKSWQALEGAPPVSFMSAIPLAAGGVLLANQAGQLLVTGTGSALSPLPAQPIPSLTGLLMIKDKSLLALTLGGVVPLAAPGLNGNPK
jgi:photosystem II stability/assembly factor-like uncharacterized protein